MSTVAEIVVIDIGSTCGPLGLDEQASTYPIHNAPLQQQSALITYRRQIPNTGVNFNILISFDIVTNSKEMVNIYQSFLVK